MASDTDQSAGSTPDPEGEARAAAWASGCAALAGWRWSETEHGIALVLQLAHSAADFSARRFDKVILVMNDRQLRSLGRDLARAAGKRGIPLYARKPLARRAIDRLVRLARRR